MATTEVAMEADAPLLTRLFSSGGSACRSEVVALAGASGCGPSALRADIQQVRQETEGSSPAASCRSTSEFEPALVPQKAAGALPERSGHNCSITHFDLAVPASAAGEVSPSAQSLATTVMESPGSPMCAHRQEEPSEPDGPKEILPWGTTKTLHGLEKKPKLMLPVPVRQGILPPTAMPAGPGLAGVGPQGIPAALRSGRPLPARLQALDDQTVMPRDVYNKMFKLGDAARGRCGYAQHRLAFVGPEGVPVLQLAA